MVFEKKVLLIRNSYGILMLAYLILLLLFFNFRRFKKETD